MHLQQAAAEPSRDIGRDAGFSASPCEKSPGGRATHALAVASGKNRRRPPWHWACSHRPRALIVFRATVLTLVLLFAAGPSASLGCGAWCDPHIAASNGCHHAGPKSSAILTSGHSCQGSVPGMAILLREDVRRAWSTHSGFAAEVATFQFTWLSITDRPGWHREHAPSNHQRPLTTPLRL